MAQKLFDIGVHNFDVHFYCQLEGRMMAKRRRVEKAKMECKIIDVTVPNDVRVENKEQEKVEKFQDLRGAESTLLKKAESSRLLLVDWARKKKIRTADKENCYQDQREELQKSTSLGNAKILRRT